MVTVTIKQAKADLDQLVARAEAGEEVVISRGRGPTAKLVSAGSPQGKSRNPRRPGELGRLLKGLKGGDRLTHSPGRNLNEDDLGRSHRINRQSWSGGGFAEDGPLELDGLPESIRANREFIITRDGMPVARVVPMTSQSKRPRIPGALKGQFTLPESFFHPLPEAELLAWEGSCSFDAEKGQGETSDFKKS